jgi:tetratricopeptide (TPR) repeat protein
LALVLAALGGIPKLHPRAMGAAALAVSCVLAFKTSGQESIWRNSYALWKDTADKNPFSYTAANNLAEALLNRGDFAAAVDSAGKAIQITEAREANPFATAAVALNHLGRAADADAAFRKAAELDARYREPDKLVKALLFTEEEARRLEVIARRNL